jgi:hypothetical protein
MACGHHTSDQRKVCPSFPPIPAWALLNRVMMGAAYRPTATAVYTSNARRA